MRTSFRFHRSFSGFETSVSLPLTPRCYLDIIYTMIEFEWDESKNKANRKKHGIWFEEAQSVFDDVHGRLFIDARHSDDEDRFVLIGYSSSSRLLVVIHCQETSETTYRIISARKATKKEREFYEKGI